MHPPGVYLHVPFCAALCHYCDFNRVAGSSPAERARYVTALLTELEQVAAAGPGAVAPAGAAAGEPWPLFGSIFVGGGTPTLLEPADLARVVRRVREVLPVARDAEVTVEANPETIDAAYCSVLRAAGVNRLSLGGQSFAPHVLDDLGRWHHVARPVQAVEEARSAGIGRVNLDLIYGSPRESADDWSATLDTALATGVEHVSAYALTVEPGTEYAARIRRGSALAPDEDVLAERMAAADQRLAAAGLGRYEISNWARPGGESRHNLGYWRGGDWLGLGAGAHGHWQGRRWWNLRPPGRYAMAALDGHAVAGEEVLDAPARRTERLMMGLRLAEGVPRAEVEPVDEQAAGMLVAAGLLLDDGQRLRLAARAQAVANAVIVRLLPAAAAPARSAG